MAYHDINGLRLWVEEEGSGPAIVFVHEFGGDHRSWRHQVNHFRDRFRCVTYSARGYPPTEVPADESNYSQNIATADLLGVLDSLEITSANIIGLSMGAYTGLRFTLDHPDRVSTLVAASGGSGSFPQSRAQFLTETRGLADMILENGNMDIPGFATSATRIQLKLKNPKLWEEFTVQFAEHSATGSAYTLRGVQARRPSLYELEDELQTLKTPILLMIGDEDEPCIDTNIFLKRTLPSAGLVTFPKAGHLINLEEPSAFNSAIENFYTAVAAGLWHLRDESTTGASSYLSEDV